MAQKTASGVAEVANSRFENKSAARGQGDGCTGSRAAYLSGAGEGIRTLDMQLGKLPLYRLSYSRPMARLTKECYLEMRSDSSANSPEGAVL